MTPRALVKSAVALASVVAGYSTYQMYREVQTFATSENDVKHAENSQENIETNPAPNQNIFSDHQITMAALWWAAYLPGVEPISFDEINKNAQPGSKPAETLQILHDMHTRSAKHVTKEQIAIFIRILKNKILDSKIRNLDGLDYIQIGNHSSYDPPRIITEALQEAEIKASAYLTFPMKTEMKIYNNGQIFVNDEVYATDPACIHYGEDFDFSAAHYMVITGAKFRIVPINLDEVENTLYTGPVSDLRPFDSKDLLYWNDDKNDVISVVFAKIPLRYFNGSEADFLALSNNELTNMLQDPEMLIKHFPADSAYIEYRKSREKFLGKSSYRDIGEVTEEKIGTEYYQHTTGPVKVMSAPQAGTVGYLFVTTVAPNDFIIKRDNKNKLNAISKGHRDFQAKLSDKQGKLLSDLVFKPGDAMTLPLSDNINSLSTSCSRRM
jgi:hypothetical protein